MGELSCTRTGLFIGYCRKRIQDGVRASFVQLAYVSLH